ncbi:DUF3100 domain-containing protein [Rhodococcus erythropolis]|uniref:DUF3100 domain-containing protein n=1 Tax=Rhodococcus erythropolis TaxID=1833 RepID=UPI003A4E024E
MTEAFPVSHDDSPVSDQTPTQKIVFALRSPRLWTVAILLLALAAGAQLIGPAVIPVGAAAITILPMVWGLIAGGAVSSQKWKPLGLDLQAAASAIMGLAVLLLCARLSFTIGPNIQLLFEAGPALLLQELGHLFGTIALALPLAVLLRMGPPPSEPPSPSTARGPSRWSVNATVPIPTSTAVSCRCTSSALCSVPC